MVEEKSQVSVRGKSEKPFFYFCFDGIQSKAMLSALVVKKARVRYNAKGVVARLNVQAAKRKKENKVRKKKGFRKKRTPPQKKAPRARTRRLRFSASSPLEQESNALCDRGGRARAERQRNGATLRRERYRLCFDTLLAALVARCRSRVFFYFASLSTESLSTTFKRLTAMLATLSANEERMAGLLKLPKGEGEGEKGVVSPSGGRGSK